MNHALDLPDHLLAALLATMGEEVAVADLVGVPQYQLGAKMDIRQRKLLEERVGEEEVEVRARLQSLTLPHAGDWLHAAPILAPGVCPGGGLQAGPAPLQGGGPGPHLPCPPPACR